MLLGEVTATLPIGEYTVVTYNDDVSIRLADIFPEVMFEAFRLVTLTSDASIVPVLILLPLIVVYPGVDRSVNVTMPENVIVLLDNVVPFAVSVNVLELLPLTTDIEIPFIASAAIFAACVAVVPVTEIVAEPLFNPIVDIVLFPLVVDLTVSAIPPIMLVISAVVD